MSNKNKIEQDFPIDTQDNSSFLNAIKLINLQEKTKRCIATLESNSLKKRDQLKIIQQFFTFEKTFGTRGVQGITGILKVKGQEKGQDKIVFKVSIDLDNGVEHENIVTKDLNNLRNFCPHFVGNIGMVNIPVSNDYIENPESESLFKNSNDYFPCNVLLIEYVSPISLYHLCKYQWKNKSLIISQLIQSLMGLDIAQQKRKLTHYDAHLDNILIRKIEDDSFFLYVHKGHKILVPTYGYYPVFIDMGSSYVKAIEGNPMYTSADNYHNGLQPTLYDPINDIHHLLVSVTYYLKDKEYVYDYLRTRLMYLFRHIPILSHKGWKQLPYDILDLTIKKIKSDCPGIKNKFKVYKRFQDDIIEVMNGLIILPWLDNGETNFNDCMFGFLEEIEKINRMKLSGGESDIVYVLRETVLLINKYRKLDKGIPLYKTKLQDFIQEWKKAISFLIHHNMNDIPKNLDFTKLIECSLKVADRLSANYYEYVKVHVEKCNEAYIKTKITCPMDAVFVLLQNATPKYQLTKNSKIYIWNSEQETKNIYNCNNLTDNQLEELDNTYSRLKGEKIWNYINK